MEPRTLLTSFLVNSDSDADNGGCDAMHCSLREAIIEANATPGFDDISFAIPGPGVPSLRLASELPAIIDPVAIDGTTQPGGRIELDGSSAGEASDGLKIIAGQSTVRGLVINRFAGSGMFLQTGGNNRIEGNFIGTDWTGQIRLANDRFGILLQDSPNNTIGGAAAGAGNVISGNRSFGLSIDGSSASGNRVLGNRIGTDWTGTQPLGNGCGCGGGIFVRNAPRNSIGGSAAGEGNVISGNNGFGLVVQSPDANGTVVQGNYVGTDNSGSIRLGNALDGISIENSHDNWIGGTSDGARNIISANGANGIAIASLSATGNHIVGNYIGTDRTGTIALGNRESGVLVEGPDNIIGGTTIGEQNIISANGLNGIHINYDSLTGRANLVLGNLIGTDANATGELGNGGAGVFVEGGHGNTIGGTAVGAGNIIAHNGQGVVVLERCRNQPGCDGADGNSILGNSIRFNDVIGIDLGNDGPTPNDALDNDIGPNDLINFPELVAARRANEFTELRGIVHGEPGTTERIEFFANTAPDQFGLAEGERFVGTIDQAIGSNGTAEFLFQATGVNSGELITATATDPAGNTSEFSPAVSVTAELARSLVKITSTARAIIVRGDGGNNVIAIEWTGLYSFDISAGDGTQIEGDAGPISSFHGYAKNLRVFLGDGDDRIELATIQRKPRIAIDTGAGDDTISVSDSVLSQELILVSGPGNDQIALNDCQFNRAVFIDASRHDDILDFGGSRFNDGWIRLSRPMRLRTVSISDGRIRSV